MTTKKSIHRTESGRELTDDDIEALADEVARTDYDVSTLRARPQRSTERRAVGEIVVSLDPALRDAVEERARAGNTTTSEIIRRALHAYINVA